MNYGIPDDYEELERRGIDVAGKIVIARYGGSWRGIKPKVAHEHGGLGVILYSDPRDDGYLPGRRLSDGPYRMEHGRATRLRAGHAAVPRRPADAGVGATRGRGAARAVRKRRRS